MFGVSDESLVLPLESNCRCPDFFSLPSVQHFSTVSPWRTLVCGQISMFLHVSVLEERQKQRSSAALQFPVFLILKNRGNTFIYSNVIQMYLRVIQLFIKHNLSCP